MRIRLHGAALLALALVTASCTGDGALGPAAGLAPQLVVNAAPNGVRISEIHYDNVGTDVGEAVEISGPAGMDVTGWKLVLYNGNGSGTYGTPAVLSGAFAASCSGRGVMVVTYPVNGLQNGGSTSAPEPDGIALVDAADHVIEFLSYEGTTITAINGPAAGQTSTNIGVSEAGNEPTGKSLQRSASGSWSGPVDATFGACNDAGDPEPPAEVASIGVVPATVALAPGGSQQVVATALDADGQPVGGVTFTWSSSAPAVAGVSASGLVTGLQPGSAVVTVAAPNGVSATVDVAVADAPPIPATRFSEIHYDNTGTDVGEAIEVEGPAGTSLTGWTIVLYNGNGGAAYGTTPLSGTIANQCSGRGTVFVSIPGIQNGNPDGFALVNAAGEVQEFLSYGGIFAAVGGAANGRTSVDIGVTEGASTPAGSSLQRTSAGAWQSPRAASFGACNGTGGGGGGNTLSFSGRLSSDPALPVGFQDQLFATLKDGAGNTLPSTVTWTSETPAIASIDEDGVMTALAAGTATVRATTSDGAVTATYSLPTRVATPGTAQYANHTEFGDPTDADASDDYILRNPFFTSSFSRVRNTPNWVAYNLDATHFGSEDRCDCFTYDPALPASFPRYTTADYTGAGATAGYGIDRGHLARSFDRESGSLDNANSFYFSNIVPQAADNNQGPWSAMEIAVGNLARFENKELFIVAGVAGSKGTVKNEGLITIPAQVWKVVVVLPRDRGLADIHDYRDLEVIAAIMPNDPGIRNVNWETYKTTVDAVEALSGYDLLALLRDDIETLVESNTHPPVAVVNGPFISLPGEAVAMSAEGSSDADGDALTFAWSFGDGATGAGLTTSHVYGQPGTYTVRLVATDVRGVADTVTTTATVLSPAQAVGNAIALVAPLAGDIGAGPANSLVAKLEAAQRALERGSTNAALGQLNALLNELHALTSSGRATPTQVAALRTLVERVIASID